MDQYRHGLAWNGREWWVTTYRNDKAISGEPLRIFLDEYPEGFTRDSRGIWIDHD